MRAKRRRSRE